MENTDFCDKYCPMPMRWVEFPKVDNELTVACDLEESECPFNDVNFSLVNEHETIKEIHRDAAQQARANERSQIRQAVEGIENPYQCGYVASVRALYKANAIENFRQQVLKLLRGE